jgi:endonuclease YncB( thermonuclease family)
MLVYGPWRSYMQVIKYLPEIFIPPHFLFFLLAIPPLSIGMTPPGPLQSYECVRVVDGDTVILKRGDRLITVRLSNIDAPESKQKSVDGIPIGMSSTKQLAKLIEGKTIQLSIEGVDLYRRTIAEIFLRGMSVNLYMVRTGYATSYPTKSLFVYRQAQYIAKSRRLGIWKSDGFTSPKNFRKFKRKNNE